MFTVYFFTEEGKDGLESWNDRSVHVKAETFQEALDKAAEKYPERKLKGVYVFDDEIIG